MPIEITISSNFCTYAMRLKCITKSTLAFLESKDISYNDIRPDPEPEGDEEK